MELSLKDPTKKRSFPLVGWARIGAYETAPVVTPIRAGDHGHPVRWWSPR